MQNLFLTKVIKCNKYENDVISVSYCLVKEEHNIHVILSDLLISQNCVWPYWIHFQCVLSGKHWLWGTTHYWSQADCTDFKRRAVKKINKIFMYCIAITGLGKKMRMKGTPSCKWFMLVCLLNFFAKQIELHLFPLIKVCMQLKSKLAILRHDFRLSPNL